MLKRLLFTSHIQQDVLGILDPVLLAVLFWLCLLFNSFVLRFGMPVVFESRFAKQVMLRASLQECPNYRISSLISERWNRG